MTFHPVYTIDEALAFALASSVEQAGVGPVRYAQPEPAAA